jgi:hypothetical protein
MTASRMTMDAREIQSILGGATSKAWGSLAMGMNEGKGVEAPPANPNQDGGHDARELASRCLETLETHVARLLFLCEPDDDGRYDSQAPSHDTGMRYGRHDTLISSRFSVGGASCRHVTLAPVSSSSRLVDLTRRTVLTGSID